MGLQRKSAEVMASELDIPLNQALALYNKALRKFSDYFDRICMSSIEQDVETTSAFPPNVIVEEELAQQR
jgi:hypothetical protein